MGKASMVVAKFFIGTKMEDPKVPVRVDAATQIDDDGGRCMFP